MVGALEGLIATQMLQEQQRMSLGRRPQRGAGGPMSVAYQIVHLGALAGDYVEVSPVESHDQAMATIVPHFWSQPSYAVKGPEVDQGAWVAFWSNRTGTWPGAQFPSRSALVYKLTGTVKALAKLRDIWGITDEEMSTLLGYSHAADWLSVLHGAKPLDGSVDRRERVSLLVRIDRLLFGLYRNNEAVQAWLKHPNDDLMPSPIQYMLKGKQRHLFVVEDYIQGLTDRSN